MSTTIGRPEDVVGLADLYADTVEACIGAVLVLAGLVLAVAALGLNAVDGATAEVVFGLGAVAVVAHHLARKHRLRAAAWVIVGGLCVVFVGALGLLPGDAVAPWLCLLVLLASALLGWRWAAAVSIALAIGVVLAMDTGWTSLNTRLALSAMLLGAASVFISWMTTRPTRDALDCAARCYVEAQTAVGELRDRQAELARFGKSLSVSYHLLQQLNLDLEHARRAANEARRLKAQFAAAVSHELRTPLNLIIGFCEMMVLSPTQAYGRRLPSGFREDLDAIYRNACHLSSLVDDILDLSQVDADRMALQREWTSICAIVDEACAPLRSLFRQRGLDLRTDIPSDLPEVFVDRTRIRQILINLLNNAARFTEQGSVTVRCSRKGNGVTVSVVDTGPGIAPEDLPYVFQEFHQFGDAERRRGGSGLGLAVCKAFAEMHHGSLRVESALGVGSSFILDLPMGCESAEIATTNRVRPGPRGEHERRVLIVDRTGQLARVFGRYLDGYHLMQLRDLKPERAGAPVLLPHAVIVGSIEDRERWRRGAAGLPAYMRIPVMLCPLKTAQRQADELGVRDYLVKPVTRAQVRAALRRVCARPSRVLLVEDDVEMQRLLARMTRSLAEDCDVTVVGDGEQALEMLRTSSTPPDVVLLDLLLPGLDGYAVLEAMRREAHLADVPVIVISARGLHSEAMLASEFAVGCEGGLTVADVMRWVASGLQAMLGPMPDTSAPAGRGATAA